LFSIKLFFRREAKQHFVKREFFETSKNFDLRETLNVILIFNIYYFCTANKKVAQTFFFLNFGMIFTWIKNNLSSAKTWFVSYFIFFSNLIYILLYLKYEKCGDLTHTFFCLSNSTHIQINLFKFKLFAWSNASHWNLYFHQNANISQTSLFSRNSQNFTLLHLIGFFQLKNYGSRCYVRLEILRRFKTD
jgi:hypothetical protein